ncbi:MAG: hypothetical protein ACFBSD_00870 [Paracoccaceae bacterium]
MSLEAGAEAFFSRSWVRFGHDPVLADWVSAARPLAERLMADPDLRRDWLRCGGTWFAGVNVFPNGPDGAATCAGVPPLAGRAIEFIAETLGYADVGWDRAQISACYPGYPQPSAEESAAAFRFRRDRDAAHVDGLLRDRDRRRRPGEQHAFILGIPLGDAEPGAAPFVVWEGSHEIMRAAFRARLAGISPEAWAAEDVTEAYHVARRAAFEDCRRIELRARPGEAYLVHRLALHGVAPWRARLGSTGSRSGRPEAHGPPRVIAYFRPAAGFGPEQWLEAP